MRKPRGATLGILLLANVLCRGAAHAAVTHRWPGDGDALDAVGDADGVVHGGVTFGEAKVDQGFVFDGVDGTVSFGTSTADVGTTDFTISFTMQTTTNDKQSDVLSNRSVCTFSPFWDIRAAPTGMLSFELREFSDNTGFATALPVNDGEFHDVIFLRQGTSVRGYIDRVLVGQNDSGFAADATNSAELIAGGGACVGQDGTVLFEGTLDEITFSDTTDPPILCGDANTSDTITASDALAALRTAVGLETCDFCLCDVNDTGNVSASDALAILRLAVGGVIALRCPDCV
jgi:hypothetical protein